MKFIRRKCRYCKRPVLWAINVRGAKVILHTEPLAVFTPASDLVPDPFASAVVRAEQGYQRHVDVFPKCKAGRKVKRAR